MEPRPEHLELDDFMAFSRARLELGRDLNVFVGENGTGKSQLLKVLYSGLEVLHGLPIGGAPNPQHLGGFLQRKLTDVFRPGPSLASLIRDGAPNARVGFHDSARLIALDWNLARSNAEIAIAHVVTQARAPRPVFIPPVDLLAFFPGFVSSYQARHLEFDETWFDTSMLLGLPPLRQLAPPLSNELGLLERLMDGRVELDPSGRFQLVSTAGDKREIALVAEGARKLGVIARLIATGAIEKGTALFWDEPETNLNPKLIKEVARVIVGLSRLGVQVFIATHSLFLLRELEMLLSKSPALDVRCFGLSTSRSGVTIAQGPGLDSMGSIAILEEELAQSDRFLAEDSR